MINSLEIGGHIQNNYNDLKQGIHATTKFLEAFFSNLILGSEFDVKNRFFHVEYVPQSIISKVPKVQIDTLKCTLEELAVIQAMLEKPTITQTELKDRTGKSLSTVKRIVSSLQEKGYICRTNGKRYGKWEVLAQFPK